MGKVNIIIKVYVFIDLGSLQSTFSPIIVLNTHNNPVLKLRPRDIKSLTQSHIGSKWQSQDSTQVF